MAATTGTFFLSNGISVVHRRTSSSATNRNNRSFSTRRFTAGEEAPTSTAIKTIPLPTASKNTPSSNERKKILSTADQPPVECGAHSDDSPLLLYLPGIDGVGLGLIRQHHRLGKVFDVLCLHIPVKDRTPFKDLVKLVETTVRSENRRAPNRPIYLVGDSLGDCLALEVATRNSDIDLVLVLSNPATSFGKSQLQSLIPLLELVPDQLQLHLPFVLSLFTSLLSSSVKFLFSNFFVALACLVTST